jgi:hypothetical protein
VATVERRFPKTVLMGAKSPRLRFLRCVLLTEGVSRPRGEGQEKAASLLGARLCQLKLPTARSSWLSALFRHARAPTGSAHALASFRVSRKVGTELPPARRAMRKSIACRNGTTSGLASIVRRRASPILAIRASRSPSSHRGRTLFSFGPNFDRCLFGWRQAIAE